MRTFFVLSIAEVFGVTVVASAAVFVVFVVFVGVFVVVFVVAAVVNISIAVHFDLDLRFKLFVFLQWEIVFACPVFCMHCAICASTHHIPFWTTNGIRFNGSSKNFRKNVALDIVIKTYCI